jgi:ABC-2 type transport system permease protein
MNRPPTSNVQQALLFQRLRGRLLHNTWQTLLGQSAIRPLTILFCSAVVWAFAFGISLAGFQFLRDDVKLNPRLEIFGLLLDLLFFALGVLLLFSGGLILYGSLFSAAETAFLLSKPVRDDQVFAYKFQGAVAFSSWAFLLLGGPILIAYGIVCVAPWYYYLLLVLFFLGFVLLPGAVGALCCLLIVNYVPQRRKQVLILSVVILAALLGLWGYKLIDVAWPEKVDREMLTGLFNRFAISQNPLLPSHWVARGLRAAANDEPGKACSQLALVWSNGLFAYLLAALASSRLYRRGFNRLTTGGSLRRRYGGAWMDRLLGACLPFVRPSTRLLVIKDFRTFRRDPQQWAQILIFSLLMVLYFANVRRMWPGEIDWVHQNGISLLNLCAISLLLCTYTGRFVYPLLSLEGRKFWVLGLLPLRRDQLLWGKFAFATAGTLLIAELLVLLSDLLLEMPRDVILLHALTVAVLSAGLSGLSVGLGACMPNFRETDPSKIAVGFGGTLNLVASLLFLLVTLGLMAGPWHLQMAAVSSPDSATAHLWVWVALGVVAGLAVGTAAVVVPLLLGFHALRQMEF